MVDAGSDPVEDVDRVEARLERLRSTTAWGSLLSVQEFTAISAAGFRPVGYVFGAAVVHLGYVGRAGRCSSSTSSAAKTDLATAGGGSFNALLRKAYGVRRLALSRAVEECLVLGGDGIVGVTLTIRPFPAGGTEFMLQGTAVRARTAIRPAAPFTSHVSAQDFAKLLQVGWVPTSLVFGISLGARHDDMRTRAQTRRRAARREVGSYTQLVRDTRRDARNQLAQSVTACHGEGVVVDEMTLHISERECPSAEHEHDHVAEASILGTAIVSFDRSAGAADSAPLTIMRLKSSSPVPAELQLPTLKEAPRDAGLEEPVATPDGGRLDRYAAARSAKRTSRSILSSSDSTSVSKND